MSEKKGISTSEVRPNGIIHAVDSVLNKRTADVVDGVTQEAVAVASVAIEESKTVGGFGVNILTICALIATSPWSWIAALVFGPIRVWAFTYSLVIAGIGSTVILVVGLLFTLFVALILIAVAFLL